MKMLWRELLTLSDAHAVVHAIDHALYQVTIEHRGKSWLLCSDDGRPYRASSLTAVREALQLAPIASARLRHQSAYDEMIGHPPRECDNTLEVPLGLDPWPNPVRH